MRRSGQGRCARGAGHALQGTGLVLGLACGRAPQAVTEAEPAEMMMGRTPAAAVAQGGTQAVKGGAGQAAPARNGGRVAAEAMGGGGTPAAGSGGMTMQPQDAGASTRMEPMGAAPNEWRMMGYDEKNWYFNPAERTLSVDNVAQLTEHWRFTVSGMPIGTPVIAAGAVYVLASGGTYAIDFETGKQLWWREDLIGSNAVTYAAGFVYVQTSLPPNVYKLNAADGKTLWGPVRNCDDDSSCSGEASPILFGDTVLIGTENNLAEAALAGSDAVGKRGAVRALDAETGAVRWVYYTIPQPGSEDGASVWSTVAVDTEAAVVYATTGNNYTVAGPNGDAFHAIDLATGERRWVNQVRTGDVFTAASALLGDVTYDYDFGANPILATIQGRKVVAAGDKGGAFWMLDRTTGEIIWSRDDLSPSRDATFGGVFMNGAFDGDAFYAASNDPQSRGAVLHRLDPEQAGASTWSYALPETTWGALSLANGVLFAPNNATLYIFSAATGELLRKIETGGTIGGGAPAIAQGRVVVKSGMLWSDPATRLSDQVICYTLPQRSTSSSSGAAGTVAPTQAGAAAPPSPASFSAVYRDVFINGGCSAGQCHSRAAAGSLDLSTKQLAYTNLVGVAAAGAANGCAGSNLTRVVPGDPTRSLLVAKLDHTQSCGGPMPNAGTLLSAALRDQVKAWISAGAADD